MYETYKVKISDREKRRLEKYGRGKKQLVLHLKNNELSGDDVFLFTKQQVKKLNNAKRTGKRKINIVMSARQVRANLRVEGGFLGMLAGLLSRFLPAFITKVAPSLLGGVATGLVSAGVEKAVGGHGIFLRKKGHVYKVEPVEGNGLCLSPHPHLDGTYENNKYADQDGLLVRTKNGTIHDGSGLLLGANSPFKHIPILGWIF
jgi:hypothetical protein